MFGVFQPRRAGFFVDFLNNSSANFEGLTRLEDLVKIIPSPKWQWDVDLALAAKGKEVYERPTAPGCADSCNDCHGVKLNQGVTGTTWKTPIQNVGTDTREYDILEWRVKTGVLRNAFIPVVTSPLGEVDTAFNTLTLSVLGSIAEHTLTGGLLQASSASTAADASTAAGGSTPANGRARYADAPQAAAAEPKQAQLPPQLKGLSEIYIQPQTMSQPGGPQAAPATAAPAGAATAAAAAPAPVRGAYEARVMHGIWAAAPYLHNGSVPTLADLLKPVGERPKEFKVGPAYDRDAIGLAVEQPQSNFTLKTTDCSDLNSGNSRCGHEFGTQLSPDDKKALLEFLKTL